MPPPLSWAFLFTRGKIAAGGESDALKIRGNVTIVPLNVALQFLDRRMGKKDFCIGIFHAGFLLKIIVKQQSQHIYFASINVNTPHCPYLIME